MAIRYNMRERLKNYDKPQIWHKRNLANISTFQSAVSKTGKVGSESVPLTYLSLWNTN